MKVLHRSCGFSIDDRVSTTVLKSGVVSIDMAGHK